MLAVLLGLFCSVSMGAVAPALDASEEFPAGAGSTSDHSVMAFSHPMGGTRGQDRRDFNVGNSFFNTVWVTTPSSTTARDGLGPTYNAVSCAACHFRDGRGAGLPDADGEVLTSLLFRLKVKRGPLTSTIHENYGGQLQPQGVPGVQGEGKVHVKYVTVEQAYTDGTTYELAAPLYEFVNLNFGSMGTDTIASPRVAPQMSGLGLVENIAEADILVKEDPYDMDGDGISGRANRVISVLNGSLVLGRFGWKAGKATLKEQNAAAFNGDIGITSTLFPQEDCPLVQSDCQVSTGDVELPDERLDAVTTYTQLLSVPARRDFQDAQVLAGRETFHKVNCTSCHTPSYTTANNSRFEVLNNQKIYPYSDFLLHDMGDELADDVEEYATEEQATSREWRTPPLWGLGLVKAVNGHTRYMHDGRARNLTEAILWHSGEAQKAREAFQALSEQERLELIKFLESL